MKKAFNLVMVLVASVVFFNGLAYAEGKGKKVDISKDVVVNGTEVKKGKYEVTFDEEKQEISIWKGNKLVARSNARKGLLKNKAVVNQLMTSKQNQNDMLKGIILAGEQETILINTNNTVNAAPQQ
ncbi:MAG: hypothetical protein IPK14_21875 [Blastocatellia bacterium]|nr:hypothetical protein [Blastocatellia bacterium]